MMSCTGRRRENDHRPRDSKRDLLHDFLDSLTEIDIDDLRCALMGEVGVDIDRIVDAYLVNSVHKAKLARAKEARRR